MRLPTLLLLAMIGLSGCEETSSGTDTPAPVLIDAEKTNAEEEDLFARRDAMLSVREKVREEREKLNEQYRAAREKGSDTSMLDKVAAELVKKEAQIVEEEKRFNKSLEARLTHWRTMAQTLSSTSKGHTRVAAREVAIASREGVLARREKDVARREAGIATRERELAKRERDTCGGGGGMTIIQTVDPKGSEYTKADVDPLLKQARKKMSRKGVMRSDLPAPARGLEREATKAMRKGNYGKARFAAAQLVATIDSIKINKGFIATKINRLNGRIRGKKLKPEIQKKVDQLFRTATSEYGDGKFSKANRRLNQIYAAVR